MATAAMGSAAMSAKGKGNRGKDQLPWTDEIWKAIDQAVTDEMMRTRMCAKFLPQIHVHKKRTTIEADVVAQPDATSTPPDFTFSVDESAVKRINEFWATFKLSPAQVEAEGQQDPDLNGPAPNSAPPATTNGQPPMGIAHRASTACSLAQKTANLLCMGEDLICCGGASAVANHPLFVTKAIQTLDTSLAKDLDNGLLGISPLGDIGLAANQVVPVHPVPAPDAALAANWPLRYAENTLNAVAQAFSYLQAAGHYENYALILNTVPYADLHQALRNTLIEPVEPVSHLVKAGIYGSAALPPFQSAAGASNPGGLPVSIGGVWISAQAPPSGITKPATFPISNFQVGGSTPNILYTGALVCLNGNTMDHVRGLMDDVLDVCVTFNQKDQNEQYRFRVVQRFALRLKDPTAVMLLLFLDS
jgi:uncharacterized linocin/CFP29 family protein